MITAVLPVSRIKYLDRVLDTVSKQTHRPDKLIVIYDGIDKGIDLVNKIVNSKNICDDVTVVRSNNRSIGLNIPDRRRNISSIHNQLSESIEDSEWVFSIEDDGLLPSDALERLVSVASDNDDVGMVTGVELGRWGAPYVGAWRVDNPDKVTVIRSVESLAKDGSNKVEEIDACGLYCALIRADKYKEHRFFHGNGLGPDVNLGIFLRQSGLKNYIDWGVHVTHLTSFSGVEVEIPATDNAVIVSMTRINNGAWRIGR